MTDFNGRRAAERLADFYQRLSPSSLAEIGNFYASDARFKDPFNEVQGLPAISHIFEHMFENVTRPRFVVSSIVAERNQAVLVWEFFLQLRAQEVVIRGVSHVEFDAAQRVVMHRDYWDAAEELYAKLPVLGVVMRFLRKKLAAA